VSTKKGASDIHICGPLIKMPKWGKIRAEEACRVVEKYSLINEITLIKANSKAAN